MPMKGIKVNLIPLEGTATKAWYPRRTIYTCRSPALRLAAPGTGPTTWVLEDSASDEAKGDYDRLFP